MGEPFIGQIIMFGGNFAPRQWAFCDGQLLPISQNSALFSILGTTYGGDGRTTFGLPEMRGRVAVHAGNGPGLTSRRLGERGGQERHTLTQNEMPAHTHTATSTSTLHAHDDNALSNESAGGTLANSTPGNIYSTGAPDDNLAAGSVTTTTTNTNAGGSQAHNIMQPFLAVNYIIALFGTFPSRS